LNPDVTGIFEYDGEFAGEPSAKLQGQNWYIGWAAGPHQFVLSTAKGIPGAAFWLSPVFQMEGVYTPQGTATGNATIAEIPI
jgi:hypothetical protein